MEPTECRPNRVCFLSDCAETVEGASERLSGKGIDVLAFHDVGSLAAGMGRPSETILALDTGVLPPEQDIPELLNQIDGLIGGRPVLVCVAHSKAIDLRLQALRAGAEAYFTHPVVMEEFTARLLELSRASNRERYRVMVVDDQPVAAVFAARVLQNAGMEARIVNDALQVLDSLEELRPDLVLMDLHMPGANGIELTTLIREHDELYDTPIIFLSSELDRGRQMDALRVGGNDFIAKPVRPRRLVETVRRRIRAYRSAQGRHQDRRERDSKTLVSRTEKACLQAQADGGCGIASDSSPMTGGSGSQRDAQLVEMIEQAIGGEGFQLMHQPIVPLRRVPGERYETTVRLKSRDGEYVSAFDFLPAAKRQGLMPAIDRWVIEHALDELKQPNNAHRRLRFFVHQAVETVVASDWLSWFHDQILTRDLIRQRPVLQFQLQDLLDQWELAVARFAELHDMAIKTCLNVAEANRQIPNLIAQLGVSLVRFPAQTTASMDSKQLARFVAQMHDLGARVIVARIEHPQAIARVWSCGVDLIQGNFLQLPLEDLSFDFNESALT